MLEAARKNLYHSSSRSCVCSYIFSVLLILNLSVVIPSFGFITDPATSFVLATTNDEEDGEEQEEEEQDQQQQPDESTTDQPQPQPQSEPLEGFILGGKINSLLPVGNDTWIADGSWNMIAESGVPESFVTQMTWNSADGSSSHTHELQNFELTDNNGTDIVMTPTDTIILAGEVDVGTNGIIDWEDVPVSIYFGNGQTVAVLLDDEATNSHFGGQAVFGLVTATTPCGSTPGPNMQILPPCE